MLFSFFNARAALVATIMFASTAYAAPAWAVFPRATTGENANPGNNSMVLRSGHMVCAWETAVECSNTVKTELMFCSVKNWEVHRRCSVGEICNRNYTGTVLDGTLANYCIPDPDKAKPASPLDSLLGQIAGFMDSIASVVANSSVPNVTAAGSAALATVSAGATSTAVSSTVAETITNDSSGVKDTKAVAFNDKGNGSTADTAANTTEKFNTTAGPNTTTTANTTSVPVMPKGTWRAAPDGTASPDIDYSYKNTRWHAPHKVLYSDVGYSSNGFKFPNATVFEGYNRLVLGFYLNKGAGDNVLQWERNSEEERTRLKKEYADAGIAVLLGVFGATEVPSTDGVDPVQLARKIATYIKQYQFDGVEIDYEDFGAMEPGSDRQGLLWAITFTTALRNFLGTEYLISHAPVGPWFDATHYDNGGYTGLHSAIGHLIDFYSVQFYNQNKGYESCETLLFNSSDIWAGTALFEIHTLYDIPLNMLVIGKPIAVAEQVNGGYMAPELLGDCVKQARAKGWNAGIMYWQYRAQYDVSKLLKTVWPTDD